MNNFSQLITSAASSIRARVDIDIDLAIILGSGLSDIDLNQCWQITKISYRDIKGMPQPTAPSHLGELRILECNEQTIAVCAGRHHLYEGYSAKQVSILSYTLAALGTKQLIITNAAGALNPRYKPGDIMIIDDHINFTGCNPLIGQDKGLGVPFPDMSQPYNRDLIDKTARLANTQNIVCHHGVYVGVTGPSLETSAERRMLRAMGADAVGMSTVIEVIAANHAGMDVIGLSAITNLALGDESQQADTIEEVLANAAIAGQGIKKLIEGLLS